MIYFLWFFMMLTVVVLVIGLIGFATNKDFNKKYANKLMRLRILFQFIALVFAMLLIWILQSGKG